MWTSASRQEVTNMEAMSVGMPIVCSKIRGNTDLIEEGQGGYLFDSKDSKTLVLAIEHMLNTPISERKKMGERNIDVMKQFDKDTVNEIMRRIYENITHI